MNKLKANAIVNIVSPIFTPEIISAYFNNNQQYVDKAIIDNSKNPSEIYKALEKANYEIENDELLSKSSNFGDIQKTLVDQIATQDNIADLETNIISSEQILQENCPNLRDASILLASIKKQNLGIERTR